MAEPCGKVSNRLLKKTVNVGAELSWDEQRWVLALENQLNVDSTVLWHQAVELDRFKKLEERHYAFLLGGWLRMGRLSRESENPEAEFRPDCERGGHLKHVLLH